MGKRTEQTLATHVPVRVTVQVSREQMDRFTALAYDGEHIHGLLASTIENQIGYLIDIEEAEYALMSLSATDRAAVIKRVSPAQS